MWIGFFLIALGLLFVLDNFHILRGDVWEYAWPLILILLGASMVINRSRRHSRGWKSKDETEK